MIKHVVHIDRNYPRKFNGVENEQMSKSNWGFDTQSDTLNSDVTKVTRYPLTDDNADDSNPDLLFDSELTTKTQYE
ncbi:hypothetical protein HUN27_25620, partial [Agrobacterium tumefaciens]|nr:hypothetical protein [Agrobacterium tumefaciens]